MNRIIATLAALFLGLGLMSATATGAHAAPASDASSSYTSTSPAATTPTALPRRRLSLGATRVSRTAFRLHGTVSPKYTGKVFLQFKSCKSCRWGKIRTARSGGAKYTFRPAVSQKGFYRAMTPKGARFAQSFSNVGRLS